jgi:hypothetical protein
MKNIWSLILAVAVLSPSLAVSQSLSDWQNTETYIKSNQPPGCGSMQWIGLQSDCQNTDVPRYCKGGAIASCRSQYEQAEKMVKDRSNVKTGIEANKSKASGESDRTKKSEWEGKVSDGEKRLAQVDSDLGNLKSDLQQRLRDAEACAAARGEIGKVFLRAVDKANGVSDAAMKPHASFAAKQWLDSHKAHTDQRIAVNVIIEDCKSGIQTIDRK